MDVPDHPTLIRAMLTSRLKQLAPERPVLTASLAQVHKRCGQPSCSCHHGGPWPAVVYPKRFPLWWGLTLFLCQLGSRRQLDYQLNTDGPELLANLNRLAGTAGASRPVEGFNTQKNSGLNLEHACSHKCWMASRQPLRSPFRPSCPAVGPRFLRAAERGPGRFWASACCRMASPPFRSPEQGPRVEW